MRDLLKLRSRTEGQALWQRSILLALKARSMTLAKQLCSRGYTSTSVATEVGRVHMYVGDRRRPGPTWVFIHGFSCQALDWSELMLAMEPYCGRMVAVDMPGHGLSAIPGPGKDDPEILVAGVKTAIQRALGGGSGVLVGNSLGGFVSVKIASSMPQAIAATVLISPAGAPMPSSETRRVADLFLLPDLAAALRFVDIAFPFGAPKPGRELIAVGMMAHLGQPHFRRFIQQIHTFEQLNGNHVSGLPRSLLVWGGKDHILPEHNLKFFAQHLKDGVVVRPEHFSHAPFLDTPNELAWDILGWAGQVPGLLVESTRGAMNAGGRSMSMPLRVAS